MSTLVLSLGLEIHWALFEAPSGAFIRGGTGTPTLESSPERCWVLVPGSDATCHRVALPPEASERKLAAAAAYALEDALAADPADLHVALGAGGDSTRLVVVASRNAMASWLATLAELGFTAELLLPDYLALAVGRVSCEGRVLVRTADGGYAAEPALANLLSDQADAALPAPPAWTAADFLRHAYATLQRGAPVNLLQGPYAPKRDWAGLLRPWRRVGALAAGLLLAVIAGLAVEGMRLTRQAEAAAIRAEAVFRSALPEVKRVVNPRAQMRAHLQSANLDGGGFLALSDVLVTALAPVAGAEITVLRFDGRRGELAVTLSLPGFEAVERVKSEVSARGGLVREGGARQDGAHILADITVKLR